MLLSERRFFSYKSVILQEIDAAQSSSNRPMNSKSFLDHRLNDESYTTSSTTNSHGFYIRGKAYLGDDVRRQVAGHSLSLFGKESEKEEEKKHAVHIPLPGAPEVSKKLLTPAFLRLQMMFGERRVISD